jgi:hypothetical protein
MNLLKFRFLLQPNDYSCGAVVFRMCLRALRGVRMSQAEAEDVTRCKPDGVAYSRLSKVMREHGLKVGRNVRPKAEWLLRKLDGQRLVVVSNGTSYASDHWELAVTKVRGWIVIADPARGMKLCRVADVVKRAREAFTVA